MVDPDIERTGKRERLCREGEAMNENVLVVMATGVEIKQGDALK